VSKQKFLVEICLHGEKPVDPIDLAICLKHLPLDASKASFKVKEIKGASKNE